MNRVESGQMVSNWNIKGRSASIYGLSKLRLTRSAIQSLTFFASDLLQKPVQMIKLTVALNKKLNHLKYFPIIFKFLQIL